MIDVKEEMRSILEREAKAILNIPVSDGYDRAVEIIVERVNGRSGKLISMKCYAILS